MAPAPWLTSRGFFVAVVLAGNAILWAIPSDVVELVAREQRVLLGRYSRTHMAWNLAVPLLSAVAVFIRCGATPTAIRKRAFAVIAISVGLLPVTLAAEIALRLRTKYPYQPDKVVYHRPPGAAYRQVYEDRPETGLTWSRPRPGFGTVECILTYDANGFRNAAVPASCDVVTVGDSFTEGSRVSDDQTWPVVFGRLAGARVYNLGVSGYSPPEYLAAVRHYGLPMRPRHVACMLYEGNDFRSAAVNVKTGVSFKQVIKTSPLVLALDRWMNETFGSVSAAMPRRGEEILSWLPVAVPGGDAARYYAFAPKQLLELYTPLEDFQGSEVWYTMKSILLELKRACAGAGASLVIVYAPNKAHVVFPLAAPSLPADKVHAFLALRAKKGQLPEDSSRLIADLTAAVENREKVIGEWCERKGIPFISLTGPLREAALAGRQVYYTYDQHWSPEGHAVAGRVVADVLRALPTAVARSSADGER